MKARTYTLLVTIVDERPLPPAVVAIVARNRLQEGVPHVVGPMAAVEVDAIEGMRPLPQAVQIKHKAVSAAAA